MIYFDRLRVAGYGLRVAGYVLAYIELLIVDLIVYNLILLKLNGT
ncbi:hypothetical protein [Solitalea canadensis]|uniref:Uncharacterized protein n=1 Tax=Solitalea canadensis (strain ATCC 29591 / DSM 3403 / JCM 21819 / LMG 8368 / NBRC 15130 / NCIMB 12057 / USAM 9D) TaxID=929556 RepID=H8KVB6_SOLCM|nr:hypothetical protein [Solitalea canadensis]AFD06174.1 hypothetical protein Solca_1067 [Solitalea canadensis DSM 3403]